MSGTHLGKCAVVVQVSIGPWYTPETQFINHVGSRTTMFEGSSKKEEDPEAGKINSSE